MPRITIDLSQLFLIVLAMDIQVALRELSEILPESVICLGEEMRYRASMDNLRFSRMPSAVICPQDEEQVAAVLQIANRHLIPITTRGAGSATTGATTPATDGWVLNFSGWTNLHIDPLSQLAYVQPGVTVADLDNAAREHGLMYPPDPGSKAYATIGGTLATNAGGLRGAKYGVTRDYVYALEGFLADGSHVRWGGAVKKYVSGYNIRDLWIGSEGTLGVITGAVLRLIPAPAATATVLLAYPDEESAITAVEHILEARLQPSILEFLDRQSVGCTRQFWNTTKPEKLAALPSAIRTAMSLPQAPAVLLVEIDGDPAAVQEGLHLLESVSKAHRIAIAKAGSPEEAEVLWTVRRGCSQAMFQLGNAKLNEDIVIPLQHYRALIAFTLELKEKIGLHTPTFGHAADGNFHVHIMYDREDLSQCARAREGITEIMQTVVNWDGVITGEHGIGLAKSPFLRLQHSSAEIEVMKGIKAVFDPNNILNPGKIFDPFEVWEHPSEKVKMPWDH